MRIRLNLKRYDSVDYYYDYCTESKSVIGYIIREYTMIRFTVNQFLDLKDAEWDNEEKKEILKENKRFLQELLYRAGNHCYANRF